MMSLAGHFLREHFPTGGSGLRRKLKRTALPSPAPGPVESDNAVVDYDELQRQEVRKEFEQVPSHMKVPLEVSDILCAHRQI